MVSIMVKSGCDHVENTASILADRGEGVGVRTRYVPELGVRNKSWMHVGWE
jgi:hypothetical protein